MAHLQLRYSEAYDASIAFWVGTLDEAYFNLEYDRWVQEYVKPAQGYVAKAQQAWDQINDQVFGCFRRFGYKFAPEEWPAYAIHRWPKVLPYKDPLTFFIVEDLDEVALVLIHELAHCHEDYSGNQTIYEPVREHVFDRFAVEPVAVQYHLITIWTQW
ncbi:MAG: hypothetical protein JW934_16510, partial [Anaerolineae bacterium]|nr:hypothetical protein [Anaerolineae bacterium]